MMQKMSGDSTQTGRVSTLALCILVALSVIAVLAAAEYAIPRWLHSGPGDSGSFFSSNSSAQGPSAPTSRPAPSIRPEPNSNSAADRYSGRSAKKHPSAHKPAAHVSAYPPSSPPNSQVPPDTQPLRSGETGRAAEENLRATEDATAHLVALEREEFDRLSDRVRAMNDRIEAAEKKQPATGPQREDLAFSQQRVQNDLNQAYAALKAADVQKAKIYLDLAKGELEKIAKLLGR
jgi:hypothetical protein